MSETSKLRFTTPADAAAVPDLVAENASASQTELKRPCPTNRRLFLQRSLSAAIASSLLGSTATRRTLREPIAGTLL